MKKLLSLLLIFLLFPLSSFTHSGRTDKYGGHHNRKTGGYHYHNAGSVHDADNPYQNHTICSICDTSVKAGDTKSGTQDIKAIQNKLTELELYSGSIDGKFSTAFRTVVKAFQKQEGLSVTGLLDEGTVGLLM